MIRITTLIRAALPVLAATLFAAPAMAHESDNDKVATADFFSCEKPVWPQAALSEGRTGTVTLMYEIDADGKVLRSMVAKSSGHADLDEAAREGIAKCKFNPGMHDGKPVLSTMRMQYVWTLK
jgi:TonB family protein